MLTLRRSNGSFLIVPGEWTDHGQAVASSSEEKRKPMLEVTALLAIVEVLSHLTTREKKGLTDHGKP